MALARSAFRLALLQTPVVASKHQNILEMTKAVTQAVTKAGADMVVLPECWNCPYGTQHFEEHAEPLPTLATGNASSATEDDGSYSVVPAEDGMPSSRALSDLAKDLGVYIVGGTIPESVESPDGTKEIFNTCPVFDRDGGMIAKHRKIHLFDIDIPDKITFKESDVLSAGSTPTTFDTEYGRIGVGICYDMRFPSLAAIYAQEGCHLVVYPGAFNTTTGPLHWELLMRARAVDNQVWVACASPARGGKGYQAWGHSSIVTPWGEVVATCEHEPAVVVHDIDPAAVDDVRSSIPVLEHARHDVYTPPSRVSQ